MNKNLYYVSAIFNKHIMRFSLDNTPSIKREITLARKFTRDYKKLDEDIKYLVMTKYEDLFTEQELSSLLNWIFSKKEWKKVEIERADLPMSPVSRMYQGEPVFIAGQLRTDPWFDHKVENFKKGKTRLPWDLWGVIYPKDNQSEGEENRWIKGILPTSRKAVHKISSRII